MSLTVSVTGLGYLGLVHAVCLAHEGFDVVGVDIDDTKVAAIRSGTAPFFEAGLQRLLDNALATRRLRVSTRPADLAHADVHFICVGTPQSSGGRRTNISHVISAAEAIADHSAPSSLIVGKSTVPVGTTAGLAALLEQRTRHRPRLAWSPEFVRQGRCVADTLNPDRVVFGVDGPAADADLALLDEIFAPQFSRGSARIVVDYATAELVKVSANAFLATKISFINAIAELCEQSGADVLALADAIGVDARIGRAFLSPGLGFGGGCLPKDVNGLRERAREFHAPAPDTLMREVVAINTRARDNVVRLATDLCGGSLDGRNVTVLGAAFKPATDDVRESPALAVAQKCAKNGARVTVHDPIALRNARRAAPRLSYDTDILRACAGADVILHLTEWPDYADLEPADLGRVVRRRCIVDARHTLDPQRWTAAGWLYRAFGRPLISTSVDIGSEVLLPEALRPGASER